jgi:NAD(P)H-dependent flavin oxidoreductase YrpB (nitropropane dioxygenase family)
MSMKELVGAEFPLFAFSHCRDVVAAVSRAGGFGVLGGAGFTPETLEQELAWIEAHNGGKPYGIDLLVPEHQAVRSGASREEIASMVPPEHRAFLRDLLERNGIRADGEKLERPGLPGTMLGEQLLEVAFRHPIRLIANALGIAPPMMIEMGRKHSVPVAALVGAKEHAVRQVNTGVDLIVAQGTEAGGHCGEVSTLVLVPEVLRAIKAIRDVPVLAAGGIMTGRQMAGMMAMGAAGVWTGSVWLATIESETTEIFREKMVAASSRDTVRSKYRTGKPSRQLRSTWHDAWEAPGAPAVLPMPVMGVISEPAMGLINRAAAAGNPQARALVTYFVGQGVGLVDSIRSAAAVVHEFKEDFAEAVSDIVTFVEDNN